MSLRTPVQKRPANASYLPRSPQPRRRPPPPRLHWSEDPSLRMTAFLMGSLVLHLAFILLFGRAKWMTPGAATMAPWTVVELREMSRKATGSPKATAVKPPPKPAPKPEPKKEAPAPKALPQKIEAKHAEGIAVAKPKPKEAPKEKPKAKPEEKPEDRMRMATALARIRAQEEEAMRGEQGPSRAAAGGVSPPDLVSRYAGLISDQIRRHWILHEELARQAQDERLAVVVGIVVRRDGAVLRSWIDESSGASLFDDAALRAVSRASPLPAFTSGMNEDQLEVALRFRAEDLL